MNSEVRARADPVLRPGAELLEVGDTKLHVSFPNHTVTFNGVAAVRGVRALVSEMDNGAAGESLTHRAAQAAQLDAGFVDYLLNVLASSQCLYWPDHDEGASADSELERHFASVGESPATNARSLKAANLVVLAADRHADALRNALDSGGLSRDVLAFAAGTPAGDVESALTARAGEEATAIVSWGFPYGDPVSRLINAIALRGVPVLFGSCEGLVGRIGPLVVPGSTPCLECLNSRLLSNAGQEEYSRLDAHRLRHAHAVAECRPVHPALLVALASLFVLEIEDIVLGRPPTTLGGILELSLPERTLQRREVLKAPYCDACAAAVPPRFAWDVRFDAPIVKDNRAES
jgi:bacteriocin biosynthesis cyclodehydratase domain-containing protein